MTERRTSKRPLSKKDRLARLTARRDALTGRGTELMRASLQAQIDELKGKPKPETEPS